MNRHFLVAAIAFASLGAVAQTPPSNSGNISRPPEVTNPAAAGGPAAAAAQTNVDAKKGGMPMATAPATSSMGMGMGRMDMKAMDTNGDGMISRSEWDAYHAKRWGMMGARMKNGMMPMTEMESMMNGGPN